MVPEKPENTCLVEFGRPKPKIGAIGRAIDFELTENQMESVIDIDDKKYYKTRYAPHIVVEWDDRNSTSTHELYDIDFYADQGETKWVWKTEKRKQQPLPEIYNKYGQKIEVGSIVAGCAIGGVLAVGQVTRFTKSTIWVNVQGLEKRLKPSGKEYRINSIMQTIVLPDSMAEDLFVELILANS